MEKNLEQYPSNCLKVALYGPESTGKTTLAQSLAKHYNTAWVPEYAREYLEKKWHEKGEICASEDIYPIGVGQMKLENKAARHANKLLFCDTTLLSTQVYSEAYFEGWCDERIVLANKKNKYDIYFLTEIDVPWEKDLLRDRPNQREVMFGYFTAALKQRNINFVTLKGSIEARMKLATDHIQSFL